jgi:hypothetical protein
MKISTTFRRSSPFRAAQKKSPAPELSRRTIILPCAFYFYQIWFTICKPPELTLSPAAGRGAFPDGAGRDISLNIPVEPSFISKSNSKTLILNPAWPSGVGKGKMWEVGGEKVIRSRTLLAKIHKLKKRGKGL